MDQNIVIAPWWQAVVHINNDIRQDMVENQVYGTGGQANKAESSSLSRHPSPCRLQQLLESKMCCFVAQHALHETETSPMDTISKWFYRIDDASLGQSKPLFPGF